MHPVQEHTNTLGIDLLDTKANWIYVYEYEKYISFTVVYPREAGGLVVWASS